MEAAARRNWNTLISVYLCNWYRCGVTQLHYRVSSSYCADLISRCPPSFELQVPKILPPFSHSSPFLLHHDAMPLLFIFKSDQDCLYVCNTPTYVYSLGPPFHFPWVETWMIQTLQTHTHAHLHAHFLLTEQTGSLLRSAWVFVSASFTDSLLGQMEGEQKITL